MGSAPSDGSWRMADIHSSFFYFFLFLQRLAIRESHSDFTLSLHWGTAHSVSVRNDIAQAPTGSARNSYVTGGRKGANIPTSDEISLLRSSSVPLGEDQDGSWLVLYDLSTG